MADKVNGAGFVVDGEWVSLPGAVDERPPTKREVARYKREARKADKPQIARKPAKQRGMQYAKPLACLAGGIQASLLGLSVVHCTDSITLLTGSHWSLAACMAIGIDAGMLASEAAEIVAHGRKGCAEWIGYARGYTIGTVLLSMVLNGYAFSQHSPAGMAWAGWALGAVIPGLLYALGKVACGLWLSAE